MSDVKRVVSTGFWDDEKVVNTFSPEDKFFMLYLLTNPHTTQLGIYRLVPKQAAFELGYSEDSVKVLLDRFETKYGLIKYSKDTSEVAIKNYLRHSIIKGGKPVMDCLLKEESKVKDKSLLLYIYNSIKNNNNLNTTVEQYIEHIKDNNNDNDNERIVDESYHESSNRKRFAPPSVEEVEKYCLEKSHVYVFPDEFVSFYASKNWMVGKNKMSDWHKAVSGWNSRAKNSGRHVNRELERMIKNKKYEPQSEAEEPILSDEEWARL